jgi:hypothetical protein
MRCPLKGTHPADDRRPRSVRCRPENSSANPVCHGCRTRLALNAPACPGLAAHQLSNPQAALASPTSRRRPKPPLSPLRYPLRCAPPPRTPHRRAGRTPGQGAASAAGSTARSRPALPDHRQFGRPRREHRVHGTRAPRLSPASCASPTAGPDLTHTRQHAETPKLRPQATRPAAAPAPSLPPAKTAAGDLTFAAPRASAGVWGSTSRFSQCLLSPRHLSQGRKSHACCPLLPRPPSQHLGHGHVRPTRAAAANLAASRSPYSRAACRRLDRGGRDSRSRGVDIGRPLTTRWDRGSRRRIRRAVRYPMT